MTGPLAAKVICDKCYVWRMGRKEIFILTKDGTCLFESHVGVSVLDTADADIVTGFLSAVNSFAMEMGWPAGVTLIRSGSLECRICPGRWTFAAIVVDQELPWGYTTEPVIEDLAAQICQRFEEKYAHDLQVQDEGKLFNATRFTDFHADVDEIFAQFKAQAFELYQKLILTEAIYAHVPQKWCVPLIEHLTAGMADVTGLFPTIIKMYPYMKRAITKVNGEQAKVWDLFGIKTYQVTR